MFMILGFTNILNQLGKWKYITITMFFCDTSALESAK
jgi:hypothetical protein